MRVILQCLPPRRKWRGGLWTGAVPVSHSSCPLGATTSRHLLLEVLMIKVNECSLYVHNMYSLASTACCHWVIVGTSKQSNSSNLSWSALDRLPPPSRAADRQGCPPLYGCKCHRCPDPSREDAASTDVVEVEAPLRHLSAAIHGHTKLVRTSAFIHAWRQILIQPIIHVKVGLQDLHGLLIDVLVLVILQALDFIQPLRLVHQVRKCV
mmetsp:Transcript_39196/g.70203  ORF Transcript_39196/g.70203 Transcript_39196/m.70203 type:complete len:209 (-) Transcript_39196:1457-2083(-)